jgi:Golgi nucleoside diphosphatase
MCLVLIACLNYGLNVYLDTTLRSAAITSARFAALADTSLAQAQQVNEKLCAKAPFGVRAVCRLELGGQNQPTAVVKIVYQPLHLVVFEPPPVVIRASVALEIEK